MAQILENNSFVLGAILIGLAWLGFVVDARPIGKKISGVVWVLVGGMLLSNFKLIPFKSPAYDFVGGILVPLSIPLLLFKADLKRIFKESGRVMLSFIVASFATILGAVSGFYILNLGAIGPKVAGVYTGAYIGGAVNLVAVSQAVEMTDTEFSSAISASSVVSIIALMVLLAIPSIKWIYTKLPNKKHEHINENSCNENTYEPKFKIIDITGSIALSFFICAGSTILSEALNMTNYNILFITVFTLIIANIWPKAMSKLQGEFEVGILFMYIFFAAVGAGTDALKFINSSFILFIYGMIIITIHFIIILIYGKLFKINLSELIVASGAALVGPSVTATIAISRGWRDLITPAIMCGIFGYAIATFIGYGLSKILSGGAI